MATLTYVYADSTAVLGPLASFAEPHCYDLCEKHSARLTAPRGWEVIHLARSTTPPAPGPDDLLALADAVREAANAAPATPAGPAPQREQRPTLEPPSVPPRSAFTLVPAPTPTRAGRRNHLHMLPD